MPASRIIIEGFGMAWLAQIEFKFNSILK